MSLIHGDIAAEHKDDVKAAVGKITYEHFQKKDEYDSESKFVTDLTEKIVDRLFIENAYYTEKLVVTMVKELFSEK